MENKTIFNHKYHYQPSCHL